MFVPSYAVPPVALQPLAKADVAPPPSPTDAQLQDLAHQLHSVGDRPVIKDDYDKRLAALATDYLPKLDQADRGRFMKAILETDKGAYDSWFQGTRLDGLVKDGRVSPDQRQQLLESMADGYNKGDIDSGKVWQFFDMPSASKGYRFEQHGKDNSETIKENKSDEIYQRFSDGLNKSDGSKSDTFASFITNFTRDQINAGQPGDSKVSQSARGEDISVLFNAANQVAPNQKAIADIMGGVDTEKRAQVMDDLSKTFGNQTHINEALLNMPAGYKDPMALYIDSVANTPTTDATKGQAAEIADYVQENSENNPYGSNDYYDEKNKPKPERQAALSDLMKNKGEEIFNDEYLGQSGIGDDGVTAVQKSVDVLANMERLTGLAPGNPEGDAVIKNLGETANGWRQQYTDAKDKSSDQAKLAEQHLEHIVASSEKAVRSGFADKAEDEEAAKADAEQMLNLISGLVGAVPGLGSISEGIKTGFEKIFGAGSAVTKGVDEVIGKFGDQIDEGGGLLTDKAKEAIVDKMASLSDQDRYLEEFKAGANNFIQDQLLNGLSEAEKRQINIEASELIGPEG